MSTTNTTATAQEFKDGGGPPNALVWVFLSTYLLFLLCIAARSFYNDLKNPKTTVDENMRSHYLGGRSFGNVVLGLSVFATVYSGYTVVGVPQETYTSGFYAYRWLYGIIAMVPMIAFFGGRLQHLTSIRGYISPTDFIKDRFNSHFLTIVFSLTLAFPAMCYVLAQFLSMGSTIEGLSDGKIEAIWAATVLCIVMVSYEAFGGLRAIAWTDALQGFVLVSGFLIMYLAQQELFGGVERAGQFMEETGSNKMLTEDQIIAWFGFGTTMFFGYVFYPQMIQRYQAAPDSATFRNSILFLFFGTWLAMTSSLCTGMVAKRYFGNKNPNLAGNQTFGQTMRVLCNENFGYNILGSMMVTASVAAFMSTADSALNGLSCCLTLDLVKPYPWLYKGCCVNKEWTALELNLIGKAITVAAAVVALIMSEEDFEMGALLTLQNAFLCQCFPPMFLGMVTELPTAFPTLIGFLTGTIWVAIVQCHGVDECVQVGAEWYWPFKELHPAMFAMAVNFSIIVVGSSIERMAGVSFQPRIDMVEEGHEFPKKLIGVQIIEGVIRPYHFPYNLITIAALFLCMFDIPFWRPRDEWGKPEKFTDGLPEFIRQCYGFAGASTFTFFMCVLCFWSGEAEKVEKKTDDDYLEPVSVAAGGQVELGTDKDQEMKSYWAEVDSEAGKEPKQCLVQMHSAGYFLVDGERVEASRVKILDKEVTKDAQVLQP